jgi:DNA-binding SARP family transcriptional activator/WD40 repeat protein
VARVGRVVGVDELVDALWPVDPPRTAAKSLQTYVLRLRNSLEPDRDGAPKLIITDGPGYRLAAEERSVDAHRFARLVELGRRALDDGHPDVASATLRDALGMWRGSAYAGFEQTRFGAAESRRLEELRRLANEDRLNAELDLGRAREAAAELESLTQDEPLRERLWCLLMVALVRTGRQADALAAYARARALLADELGIDPGPELRGLHARVLAQDPSLLATRRTTPLPAPLLQRRGAFVGRSTELGQLRDAWRGAASGTPTTVALRGPRRSGRTRLAAELAAELAEAGTLVEYGASAPTEPAVVPTLSVITSPSVDAHVDGARLAVMIGETDADFPSDSTIIDVGPLADDDVRVLVSSYVDAHDVAEAMAYVVRESEGWPGRVHDEALAWARRRISERVDAAVSRVQLAGADLTAVRAQLVDSVAELHEVEQRADGPLPDEGCPWRGLASYDVADGPWFAGRERLVAELVSRLAGPRLVGVVGPSGSGKSSLVRAGLLAALANGSLPGSETWTHVLVRPGQHPMRALAMAALAGGGDRGQVGDLLERLIRGEAGDARTVLVVDQLEEVWTACPDPVERTSFLDTLSEVYGGSGGVCVVLVLRADFVSELAEHHTLARALSDATVLVGAPSPSEMRRAIERPGARAGLEFEVGLVDALVADAGAEPGTLPLLSTALVQLWDGRNGRRLTLARYVAMGGLSGAIARLAESAYAELEDDERRETARRLLLRLTGPGTGEGVTRRRVPIAEIDGLPDRHVRSVVDAFADARLLSVSEGHIEVAHEALFREWPRLRSWLSEDAAGRAVAHRLAPAASEWAAESRETELLWRGARLAAGIEFATDHPDELTGTEREFLTASHDRLDAEQRADQERAAAMARQNRRLRWLLGGIGVLLIVALVAGLLAMQARGRAETALSSADARRLAATALTEDYIDRGLLDAVEGANEQRSPETLGALLTVLSRSPAAVRVIRIPDRFFALSAAPDGSAYYAAVNTGQVWKIDGRTGTATMWQHYGKDDYTQGVAVSPNGALVAVGTTSDGVPEIDVYRAADGGRVSRFDAANLTYLRATWSPDATVLYLPAMDGLLVVDPQTGAQLRRIPWETFPHPTYTTLAALPDGRVAIGFARGSARLVDPRTGQVTDLPGVIPGVLASPDGRLLAEPGDDATVLWDVRAGREVQRLPHRKLTDIMAFSPDGKLLLTGGEDQTVRLWDVDSGELREEFAGHTGKIMGAAFAPDGRTVWTAGRDGAIVAWDVTGSRRLAVPGQVDFGALAGDVSADGKTAVVIDGGAIDRPSTGVVWDVTNHRKVGDLTPAVLPRPGLGTMIAAITPDGKTAITMLGDSASKDGGFLLVHDVPSGAVRHTIPLPFPAAGADLTPDGTLAVVNGNTGIAVVDLGAGRLRGDVMPSDVWSTVNQEFPVNVAMSRSGRWAAVARAATVSLVDVGAGRVVASWPNTDGADVMSLAWTVDGRTLAYGDVSGRVSFRAMPDGSELEPPRLLFPGYVLWLAASPDGKWMAAAGTDGELTLIDTATWAPVGQPLPGPVEIGWGFPIWQPDSAAVTLWYETGKTLRWEVGADRWIDRACRVAHRDLTASEWQLLRPDAPWQHTCGTENLAEFPL